MQIEIRKPLEGQSGQLVICTCDSPKAAGELIRYILECDKGHTMELIVKLVSRYEE